MWIGKWRFGRVRDSESGPVFVFERSIKGKPYTRAFRVADEDEAIALAVAFRRDPLTFAPEAPADAPAVNPERLEAFREYQTNRKLERNYVADTFRCLTRWAELLAGKDLRMVKLKDLAKLLNGDSNRRAMIVAIKAFTKWLRSDLRAELDFEHDPTLGLAVPKGTPEKSVREKAHPVEAIEKLYAHLDGWEYIAGVQKRRTDAQPVRDVIRIAATTGLHLTEIDRLARGLGRIDLVEHPEIAGVFRVWHKNDKEHAQSVPRETLAAMHRLQGRGYAPQKHEMSKNLRRACAAAGVNLVRMGDFRHTFNTWGRSIGSEVKVNGAGIARGTMAEILGHDAKTNRDHYDESIPSMAKIPIRLEHPHDPGATIRVTG